MERSSVDGIDGPNTASSLEIVYRSFNLSFIVFFIFDRIWALTKISYRGIFLGYAVVCAFCLLISIFLWPDQPFSREEQILDEPGILQKPEQINADIGKIRAPSVFKHASIGRPAYKPVPERASAPPPELRSNIISSQKAAETTGKGRGRLVEYR